MELTNRQKRILAAVLELYSKKAKPVSSKSLIKTCRFKYSPATIRSEMYGLEKLGLLKKPHTSAGRVPTDQGYRLYIKELMKKQQLKDNEKKKIKVKVNLIKKDNKDFSQKLAEVLADFSETLAFVGRNQEHHFHFSGLEEILEEMDQELFREIAHFMEETERDFERFFSEDLIEPGVFIGHDHPLLRSPKCGLILSPFKKGKERGVLALLGPDRMNYKKNLALIEYINELLN